MTQVIDLLPIVALHGFTGSSEDFRPIIAKLGSSHTWYSLDLPGHGTNKKNKNFDFEKTLNWLHKEISKIKNPCTLLGYSLGGRVALQFAIRYPELPQGLILISATPGIDNSDERECRKKEDEKLAQHILDIGVAAFMAEWMQKDLIRSQQSIPESIKTQMVQTRLQNARKALSQSLKNLSTGNMTPVWNKLHKIICPTLLITGESDAKFQSIAKAMLPLIPDCTYRVIPNAGHAAHLENLDYFNKIVGDFLNKIQASHPLKFLYKNS